MKITNNYNLPPAILAAVQKGTRQLTRDRISVTQLIDAPMIRRLRLDHWDEIEEDASERLWSLLGQGIHSVLESGAQHNHLVEEKLIADFRDEYGLILTGISDLFDGQASGSGEAIEDWKVTSVYAFLLGAKATWEAQLNCYDYLFRLQGLDAKNLRIRAILRDWNRHEAMRNPNYPAIPFLTVDIPKWSKMQQSDYIHERMRLHTLSEPPPCTPEEMWERPAQYAVKKIGNKRAMRVLDTEEEAKAVLLAAGEKYAIEKRPGKRMRCESFCNVAQFCPHYQAYKAQQEVTNEEAAAA